MARTLLGVSEMPQETEEDPSALREKCMSPNGTTAAGLNALDDFGGGEAIKQVVKHPPIDQKRSANSKNKKYLYK
ncbi:pyrroline-5-carboxylate reductase dimerization domain-containing protein [Bacillus sp. SL00103]